MSLLALDTATATASIAVYRPQDDTVLAELTWLARRRHTQDVGAAIERVLSLADITPDAISAFAVTTGPGSFTGVRIAISLVKGLGIGLPKEASVVGVPTLNVVAAPWISVAAGLAPKPLVVAFLQAGRGRVNWALFDGEMPTKRLTAEHHKQGSEADMIDALRKVSESTGRLVWLVGESSPDLKSICGNAGSWLTLIPNADGLRRSAVLARVAADLLSGGEADEWSQLEPLYLNAI